MTDTSELFSDLENKHKLPSGLLDAVWATESSRGKHMTSPVGAQGHFQFMPPTAKQYGLKNPNDLAESADAAARMYGDLLSQYNGDLPKALAAYNWGQGNVARKGMDKMPTETSDYIGKITDLLGKPQARPTLAPVAQAAQEAILQPLPATITKRALRVEDANAPAPSLAAKREADAFTQRVKVETEPGFLIQGAAALAGNTDQRLRNLFRNSSGEFDRYAEKGFKPPEEKLENIGRDDLQDRLEARSTFELDDIIRRQEDEQMRVETMFKGGMVTGIGLSFGAELLAVTNWVAPLAAARTLGFQAMKMAAAGRTGAAITRTIGENLATGTAIEVALQIGEGRMDMANVMLSATADITIGSGMAYSILKTANLQRATMDVLTREVAMVEQAQKNIGVNATQEQVTQEYTRLRTEEIKQPIVASVSPIPESRKLMESPDDLVDEVADAVDVGPVANADLRTSNAMSIMELEDSFGSRIATEYESSAVQQARVGQAGKGLYDEQISNITGGEFKNFTDVTNAPMGVTVTKAVADDITMRPAVKALTSLVEEYLGKTSRVIFGPSAVEPNANGVVTSFGRNHVIGVGSVPGKPGQVVHTTIHEVGHAVYHQMIAKASPELVERIKTDWLEWVADAKKGLPSAVEGRFAITSPNAEIGVLKTNQYNLNLDEWMAEQYVKHVEKRMLAGDLGKIDKGVVAMVTGAIKALMKMFSKAKADGLLDVSASADEFYTAVLNKTLGQNKTMKDVVDAGPVSANAMPTANAPATPETSVAAFMSDPIAAKYGLTGLPVATAAERAQAKAMLNLYKKADAWAITHPKDEAWDKRAQNFVDNSVFSVASTGLTLLKSNNPIARMIAAELLEDASGVSGIKHSTAAISKNIHEKFFMDNTVNDVQGAYTLWRKNAGGTVKDDFLGGEYRARFDRSVAEEIESRRVTGSANVTKDNHIKTAADSLEGAYDRIRKAQQTNKTLGWAALPGSSKGYMPHKMSPGKWRASTNAQRQVIQQSLVDQFVNIEGWDLSFSDKLASKYLQRVQARANGGHDSPIGGSSAGSAEIVEDALLSLGMSRDEVLSNMKRFNRGAAGWTKGRLDLDLNKAYTVDGKEFKLMDIFETNHIELLRSQAGRASGEVALARHGVYGRPGMETLREAMTYGQDGARATDKQLEAFDQVAAEFINAPFGDAGPKWMAQARILNTLVRLGGIVYNQFGEFINAVAHVGAVRTLRGVASMGRLRGEIKALARGEKVDNPFIGSIELLGGAEFGTDAYKIIMPFDNPDLAYPTYGRDTVTTMDRLLRGASYAQSKLSLWRTVHSVQQRAMAEQIVAKIARYVRDGKEDTALEQFGINAELRASLKADLGAVAKWDGNSLAMFDVTKMTDPVQQEALIQAVHRGVSQIIQGTFIGETGKWAHDGYLKMLTQFRTFSITSMEKQWGRQRNSRGVSPALGILLGSMGAAAPVYMARVYASSIGREDQEAYLEERLRPELIARQTLNYVALSGLLGDFLDTGAALLPDEYGTRMTGGRAGTDTDFVGNMVAPSLSLVDDVWKAVQNLDDPEKLARVLPGSRLPFVLPAVNALGD